MNKADKDELARDERIVAYLDGGMTAAERTAFEADCTADPTLAAQVETHRWLGRQIAAAFGPPPGDVIPPVLLGRLGLGPALPPLRGGRALLPRSATGWHRALTGGGLATALAASLAFGLWLGSARSGAPDAFAVQRDSRLLAAGALDQALSRNVSGQSGPIRITMTIRTAQGLCRTFATNGGTSGLACRSGTGWAIPMLTSSGQAAPQGGDYRLAGGDVSPAVMAEVDRRIVGDPLGPDDEKTARNRGWR